ncbi:LAFE_0A01068g1_1 [Lachancea fermentati]|uniref:LAFE_0A01068g1_1 n=1 Tax=Lachancea fermentati TaxID=4955 RepID=A0A1G4M6E7_LACFM|nr:LAFE_0A01068g1_1 [Lachancea fermentati]
MLSDIDILASFSPDAGTFAFKSSGLHKKFVDLYPLSPSTNYRVTSSLVNHIDYERDDLKMEELKFTSWVMSSADGNSIKTKRKLSDEEHQSNGRENAEAYFLTVFQGGKIVIFSPTGKEILNIIQNKKEIIGVDTIGPFIWILDEDKTVKQFGYKSSKALKTFHLTDGKDDEIVDFRVLDFDTHAYLSILTKECAYIVDPSKRRPTRVAKIEIVDTVTCNVIDKEHIAVADKNKIYLYNLTKKDVVLSWETQASKIENFGDYIISLGANGVLSVLEKSSTHTKSVINVYNSKILDFVRADSKIIVAWLNVNEPCFESISVGQIKGSSKIVFNEQEEAVPVHNVREKSEEKIEPPKRKISKSSRDGVIETLLQALDDNTSPQNIEKILESDKWTEEQIKQVVSKKLSDDSAYFIFDIVIKQVAQNTWSFNSNLNHWLKWLLTIRDLDFSTNKTPSRNASKNIKHIRSSLRACRDTFPVLLSMQGKLEMLREQSSLRQELSKINIESDKEDAPVQNGEEEENDILYVNGEGDEYVDALEYNE